MHDAVHEFIKRMIKHSPQAFLSKRVLEVGSMNINGSPRQYFQKPDDYVGIDWKAGPGVDIVSMAHEFKARPEGYFECVISTEMLEHDPHYQASIRKMMSMLEPGGHLIITCAGPGRHAHDISTSPSDGYYCNLTQATLLSSILSAGRFKRIYAEDDQEAHDLRFFGVRKLR